jgi:hypothetical protein
MKCAEPTRLHRKSGIWGTQGFVAGSVKEVLTLFEGLYGSLA